MRCVIEPVVRPNAFAMYSGVSFALTMRIRFLSSADVHRALRAGALLRLRVRFTSALAVGLAGVVLVTV